MKKKTKQMPGEELIKVFFMLIIGFIFAMLVLSSL